MIQKSMSLKRRNRRKDQRDPKRPINNATTKDKVVAILALVIVFIMAVILAVMLAIYGAKR